MRTQKAITLIALVITIIVLLILAGVTINLVLGPEGLLKQAQDATDKYKQAENQELNNMSNLLAQLEAINNGTGNESGDIEETSKKVTQIDLNKADIGIAKGGTATLTATIQPEDAANKEVNWTSSNPIVATVENGVITALMDGTTTITVEAKDGSGINATCEIKVSDNLATIAKPGDYVAYNVPSKSFTLTGEKCFGSDRN